MSEEFPADAALDAMENAFQPPGVWLPEIGVSPYYTEVFRALWRIAKALVAPCGCEVYKDDAGDLKFAVRAGYFMNGDTLVSYAGAAAQTVTDAATNYIYLTAAGVLTVNTTGFPDPSTTPHVRLSTIVCAAGVYAHDDITDYRGTSMLSVLSSATAANLNTLTSLTTLVDGGTPWSVPVFPLWRIDGDGAETNGGGIIDDVTLTEAAAAYCKCYDKGTTTYANLSASSDLTGWTADYQLTADAASEAADDAVYFGAAVAFPELALDLDTVATYDDDAGLWEYWDGSAWSTLTVHDNTDTTAQDGLRPFQRSGAVHWLPPADWEAVAVDSQTAFWVRWRVTAAEVTQTPLTDSKEHELVTPEDGIKSPFDGTITDLRASDASGTVHTDSDVIFFLMNFTTGDCTAALTWAQDKWSDAWSGLSLAIAAGDELGIVVTQEDGSNPIAYAMIEMIVTPG